MNSRLITLLLKSGWVRDNSSDNFWKKVLNIKNQPVEVECHFYAMNLEGYPAAAYFTVSNPSLIRMNHYNRSIRITGMDKIICHIEDLALITALKYIIYGFKASTFKNQARIILENANKL